MTDSYPGRPSIVTASNTLLLGVALLFSVGKRGRKIAEVLSALVMLVALVALVGYILDVEALYDASIYSAIALHTSMMLLLVSAAVWWSTPENQLEKYLSGPKSTGIMTRHLLSFALVVPIALGLLWLQGVRAGLYSYELGWALLVITGIACLIGFMVVTGRSLFKLEKERTRILQQLCLSTDELEGYATELETANRLLQDMSYSDPLTGLSNRRAFDECLEDEFKSLNRYHRPLSLLLIDLDKFKLYNDRFGHQAGDEALKTVGKILKENARDTDFVARIGGEEFTVVLTETDLDGAYIQAERFRHEIENYDWSLHSITISIGVAEASVTTSDPVSLFKDADEALYEAKDQGRNQVCSTQEINITELRAEMMAGAPE